MSPSVAPVRRSGSIARRNARSRAVVTTSGVSPPILSSLPGNTAAMAIARSPRCCARRAGQYTKPIKKLLIGEGVETTLSAMQLTGLPGVATSGKGFFKHLKPPPADEYIILVDNDADDGSRTDAGVLAQRLSEHGATVRLAMPKKPDGGKDGYDWNDALMGAEAAGVEALYRDEILQAPVFTTETMTTDEKYKKGIRELKGLKSRAFDEKRTAIAKEFKV